MSDRRRRFEDQRYVHFVTFSVYRRRRLLELDQPKRIVLGVFNQQLESIDSQCVGFVLMPDHVHALIWLDDPKELRRFLHGWKRMSSFSIRRWYADNAPNYFAGFGPGERFWQPKFYAFQIYSEHKLQEKLQYLHENPVRVGLAERAIDCPWSLCAGIMVVARWGVPLHWIEGA